MMELGPGIGSVHLSEHKGGAIANKMPRDDHAGYVLLVAVAFPDLVGVHGVSCWRSDRRKLRQYSLQGTFGRLNELQTPVAYVLKFEVVFSLPNQVAPMSWVLSDHGHRARLRISRYPGFEFSRQGEFSNSVQCPNRPSTLRTIHAQSVNGTLTQPHFGKCTEVQARGTYVLLTHHILHHLAYPDPSNSQKPRSDMGISLHFLCILSMLVHERTPASQTVGKTIPPNAAPIP